jgi:hypothetical protein
MTSLGAPYEPSDRTPMDTHVPCKAVLLSATFLQRMYSHTSDPDLCMLVAAVRINAQNPLSCELSLTVHLIPSTSLTSIPDELVMII